MTGAIALGLSWRGGYLVLAGLMALMAALFLASGGLWQGDIRLASFRGAAPPVRLVLRQRLVRLQVLTFFVYTGAEVTAGQWCFALLTEARGMPAAAAGAWAGLFWSSLFVGRLLLGFVAERVGPDRLARLGTVGALAGAMALAFAPTGVGLPGLLLLGFSLAPVYPMLMSRTPARLGAAVALHAVGFQVSAAMVGGLALPALAGIAADRFGLEATALVVVAAAVTLVALHETLLRVAASLGPVTWRAPPLPKASAPEAGPADSVKERLSAGSGRARKLTRRGRVGPAR
jgi:fucose permease